MQRNGQYPECFRCYALEAHDSEHAIDFGCDTMDSPQAEPRRRPVASGILEGDDLSTRGLPQKELSDNNDRL
jgi:hypothetical protein